MSDTDLNYIQEEMQRSLHNIKYICMLIDNYKLNNEQFYLNWLDDLNGISIRN